jgi:GxxExxY protein
LSRIRVAGAGASVAASGRAGYKLDILLEEAIILEIKAVDALTRVHEAQLMTYLKLSGLRLGFLLNFNTVLFKEGIKRMML